jgi:hypothetical protein
MAGFLDAGLDAMGRIAGFFRGSPGSGDGKTRWLELQNKISAYRLFQGRDRRGRTMEMDAMCRLDHYSRLFAAEGHSYRKARAGMFALEALPGLSPISIHAGAGLALAEKALASIEARNPEEEVLAEFCAECDRVSLKGFRGIIQEVFGLAVRTMYPHLLERLDGCLRRTDADFCERFWHGVGRGIYFAPCNIPPFRALPWSGMAMCLREAPHESARRNALSGFCFALTMVNLRTPAVLEAFFRHHAGYLADCLDGVQAALAVSRFSVQGEEIQSPEPLLAEVNSENSFWPLLQLDGIPLQGQHQAERLFSAQQYAQFRTWPAVAAADLNRDG